MLHTRACTVLGIATPIVQAGMSSFTSPELVAAVSNAGGLGILGALLRPVAKLRDDLARIRALTDRPFGVNHVLAHLDPEALEITLESRVPVISTAWGDPSPIVERAPVRRACACCIRSSRPRRSCGASTRRRARCSIVSPRCAEAAGVRASWGRGPQPPYAARR